MRWFRFIFDSRQAELRELSLEDYRSEFLADKEKAKVAFERAWTTRNFEIELYWKRASYFWAFIASTFVGYFALVNSASYRQSDKLNHVDVYFLICIGFVLSTAWFLINIGSKTWQRNWEVHVDLLEDEITGPLYKTVYPMRTFSVSKINEIVSFSFIVVWLLFGIKYFIDQELINLHDFQVNWLVVVATTATALAALSMIAGHGRGRFGVRRVKIYRRATDVSSSLLATVSATSGKDDPSGNRK
jgi:hypothetical protein